MGVTTSSPAVDSLALGTSDGNGNVTLAIGGNALNVNGTGTSPTDTISLVGTRRKGLASDRRKLREWGGSVVAQRQSATPARWASRRRVEDRPVADWLVGVGSLAAIALAIAMGITATIVLGKNPVEPDQILTNAAGDAGDADDYVAGLARLGIADIPGFPRAPPSAQSQTH
jgi:hypothetical protein